MFLISESLASVCIKEMQRPVLSHAAAGRRTANGLPKAQEERITDSESVIAPE
jgi:hypothetical protein